MERRRVAVVLAGLVLVGGAVVALRVTGDSPDAAAVAPPEPLPTSIRPYSAEGVLPPDATTTPPGKPIGLTSTPGPRRLQLFWRPVPGADGYQVSWGDSASDQLLVGEPDAEIDGLPSGRATRVQVESVDAYGRRSAPATITDTAQPDSPAGADNAMLTDFDNPASVDPQRWDLLGDNDCAQSGRPGGPDGNRLVIQTQCGQQGATLRSRVPLRLRGNGPELGRFTIDTDAPGETGELDIDLVPGQVAMVDGSQNDPIVPARPNTAVIDGNLPPGTIRVRIAASVDTDTNTTGEVVQVAAGPGTPTVPVRTTKAQPLPASRVGMSVRWDVVLRTDGVSVLRNGVYVGGGNVVPQWTQATALMEFGGPSLDQERDDINMIGFGGAPTGTGHFDDAPMLFAGFPDVAPGSAAKALTAQAAGPNAGVLLATIVVAPNGPNAQVTVHGKAPVFSIRYGNRTYLATPAVANTPLLPQVRYSLVARVPAAAVDVHKTTPAQLVVDAPTSYPNEVDLVSAELDLPTGGAGHSASVPRAAALTVVPPLATLNAQVLDASGNPVAQGASLPRGRAVLDVTMDGVAAQRASGQPALAGAAGFEVWLDNQKLAAVPTDVDGPAVGGDWRIAFDVSGEPAGPHSIDVRGYGAMRGVQLTESFTGYQLAAN